MGTAHTRALVLPILLATLLVALVPAPARASTRPYAVDRTTSDRSFRTSAATGRVVIIGVPGLRWQDVDRRNTPNLWRMTGSGSAAALVTRTTKATTCEKAGWLTLAAGQRATGGDCALSAPAQGPGGHATVPGWASLKNANAGTSYAAQLGLLGDEVHRSRGCTMAVGPGAAYGAADGSGRVDSYFPSLAQVPAEAWSRCGLATVQAASDAEVGRVLKAVPPGTTVLVAGISDTGSSPHLHALVATSAQSGYLTAPSTRHSGLVTLTDLTASVLDDLKLQQPLAVVGSVWRTEPSSDDAEARVAVLADEDAAAQAISDISDTLVITLFALELLLFAFLARAFQRRQGNRTVLRAAALAGAAAPVATFLVNLIPWWRASPPGLALGASIAAITALIAGIALAGPWRRTVLGPSLVVAGVSALALGLDVVTGSTLQLNAAMGYTALVGGRFYGFGNIAFAIFATGAILSAGWTAAWPLRRGRTGLAVGVVIAVGAVATALDGSPAWGADFGGVLAIIVATAILATLLAGGRISLGRLLAFCAVGGLVVLGFSFADSLRPPSQQTHLGKFWEQLQNGSAFGIVARKFGAMLASLAYWPYTLLTIGALALLWYVLLRGGLLRRLDVSEPTTRPVFLAALSLTLLSTLMNDSGVEISALALTVLVPALLAAGFAAPAPPSEADAPSEGRSAPAPPESRSTARG